MDVTHICFAAAAAELIRLARQGKQGQRRRDARPRKSPSLPSTSLSSFQWMQGISDSACIKEKSLRQATCIRFHDSGQVMTLMQFIFFSQDNITRKATLEKERQSASIAIITQPRSNRVEMIVSPTLSQMCNRLSVFRGKKSSEVAE